MTASHTAMPKDTRLDSWKAIALFFGKDERTVKRWEKERGLPVRRLPGASRSSVFAYTKELERWLGGEETPSGLGIIPAHEPTPTKSEGPSSPQLPSIDLRVVTSQVSWLRARVLLWAVPVLVVGGFLIYSSTGRSPIRFGNALAARHQPNAQAEDLYLKGRYFFEKRTPGDLNAAVDSFTQAIVHDPGYAQAYVGLADSYSLLREYSTMSAQEAETRARAAAQKAVELDPNLAEAHTSLAFAEFWGFLDVADADREFRRAIELDPNLARAHHWYATFLNEILRSDEALAEIERARQLDPSSKAILADKGALLLDAGHPEESLALLKQMEKADPNFRSVQVYLGVVYWETGNYAAALEQYRIEASLRGKVDMVHDIEAQQRAFHDGGVQALFRYRLENALREYEHESGSAFAVASAYGYLHQHDEAMKYLQLARQTHDIGLTSVARAHEFHWLHSDPQFRKLVTDMGMPALR